MADELGTHRDLVLYLKEQPTREKLTWLVKHLDGSKPADLVRKDSFFESLGLDADDYTTPKGGGRPPARASEADATPRVGQG